MKLKEFMKKFVTAKPEIFIILSIIYLVLGILAIHDPYLKTINPNLSIHTTTIIVWLLGLSFFWLGTRYHHLLIKLKKFPVLLVFIMGFVSMHYLLGLGWIISIIFNFLIFVAYLVFLNLKNHFMHLFVFGAILFSIHFLFVGIPILNPTSRYNIPTLIKSGLLIGLNCMVLSLIRLYPKYRMAFIFIIFLTILSTFRSLTAITAIVWIFLEIKRHKNIRLPFYLLIFMLIAFISIGYFIRISKGVWELNPLRTIEYRFGFTLHVFDILVEKSFPFGCSFGKAMVQPDKYICDFIIECKSYLSSTIFGESMMDFGLIGVSLLMFFFGSILGGLYKIDFPLYTFLMSHLIVAIEGSTSIFTILVFTYLGYMRIEEWKSKPQD